MIHHANNVRYQGDGYSHGNKGLVLRGGDGRGCKYADDSGNGLGIAEAVYHWPFGVHETYDELGED